MRFFDRLHLHSKAVLSITFSLLFTSSYAAWSAPVTISSSPSSVNPLDVGAIDTHSNTIVGWLDGNVGTGDQIFSATLPAGSLVWNAPELIFTGVLPTFPAPPLIFTDERDHQIALWGELNPSGSDITIYASNRASGTTGWPTPLYNLISGLPAGGGVSVGNLANIFVILPLSPDSNPPHNITVSSLPAGATVWTNEMMIGMDNSSSPFTSDAVQADTCIMGWKTDIPSFSLKTARYKFATEQFTQLADIPLPMGSTDLWSLSFAFDAKFQTIAFFTLTNGVSEFVYFSMLDSLETVWPSPVLVSNPANISQGLSIASSLSGTTFLLWAELSPSGDGSILAGELSTDGVLSQVTVLDGPIATVTSIGPGSNIAVDSQGNAVATWGYVAGGVSTVQVASKAVGGSWSAPLTLSSTGQFPKVLLNDQGTAVVVWTDSVTNAFLSSINSTLFDVKSPTNFLGEVIYYHSLNKSEYVLKMTWDADPISNIATYEIYNGLVLVATIPSNEPLHYVTQIPNSSSTGNYTITAIASNGNVSAAVPLTILP